MWELSSENAHSENRIPNFLTTKRKAHRASNKSIGAPSALHPQDQRTNQEKESVTPRWPFSRALFQEAGTEVKRAWPLEAWRPSFCNVGVSSAPLLLFFWNGYFLAVLIGRVHRQMTQASPSRSYFPLSFQNFLHSHAYHKIWQVGRFAVRTWILHSFCPSIRSSASMKFELNVI